VGRGENTEVELDAPLWGSHWESEDMLRASQLLFRASLREMTQIISPTMSKTAKQKQIKQMRGVCDDVKEALQAGEVIETPEIRQMTDFWLTPKLYEQVDQAMAERYLKDYRTLADSLAPAVEIARQRFAARTRGRDELLEAMRRGMRKMVTNKVDGANQWSTIALDGNDDPVGIFSTRGRIDKPGYLAFDFGGESWEFHPTEMIAIGEQMIRAGRRALGLQRGESI
jgi:hypothetical protein